jgi:hypothetical protein
MGRFMVFLRGWLFRRGRIRRINHELVQCGFDVFEVFDVGTFVRGFEQQN